MSAPLPQSRLMRGLATSFGASLGIQGINMITGLVLARALGPEHRGALAAAILWPMLLGVVGNLGLAEAVTFRVARDGRPTGRVMGSSLAVGALQSLASVAVGAVIIPIALSQQSHSTVVSAMIMLADIPMSIVAVIMAGAMNGEGRFGAFHLVRVLVVGLVLVPLVVVELRGDLTVRNAVYVYLGAKLLTLLATTWMYRRTAPRDYEFDRDTARELSVYGVKTAASSISTQLNQRVDQVLISIFLTPRQLGIYVIAVTLNSIGFLVGGSVSYVALPAVAALEPGPDRTRVAHGFIILTLLLAVGTCIPLIVLAPFLVDLLFGSAYHAAAALSRILLVGVMVFAMNRSVEAILRAVDRPLDAGLAEIIAVVAALVALAALLPLAGLTGAACASVVSALVSAAWMTGKAARALDVSRSALLLPARGDAHTAVRLVRARLGR